MALIYVHVATNRNGISSTKQPKTVIMGYAISNKAIEKYFSFFKNLDVATKKKLIIKLAESIELERDEPFDLRKLFGAWEDSRDSDTIIREIRESRVNSGNIEL